MNEHTMNQGGGTGGCHVEPGVKPQAEPAETETTHDWDAGLEELTSAETVTV